MYGFHFLVWFLCVRGVKDTQVRSPKTAAGGRIRSAGGQPAAVCSRTGSNMYGIYCSVASSCSPVLQRDFFFHPFTLIDGRIDIWSQFV